MRGFLSVSRAISAAMMSKPTSIITKTLACSIFWNNRFAPKISVAGAIGAINDNFGILGYVIIGIFAVSWIGSVAFYKLKGYGKPEASSGVLSDVLP
jgi:high-affinity nickel permease